MCQIRLSKVCGFSLETMFVPGLVASYHGLAMDEPICLTGGRVGNKDSNN